MAFSEDAKYISRLMAARHSGVNIANLLVETQKALDDGAEGTELAEVATQSLTCEEYLGYIHEMYPQQHKFSSRPAKTLQEQYESLQKDGLAKYVDAVLPDKYASVRRKS